MKLYMNDIKTNLREIREHFKFLEELGYRYKPLPNDGKILKIIVFMPDNPINVKEYHINGTSYNRIFSLTNQAMMI